MTYGHSPSLVILAGGLGSRFGGGKQIAELPFFDCTIMELSIRDAFEAGFEHLVLVINKTVEPVIAARILPRLPDGLNVSIAIQSTQQVPAAFVSCVENRVKPWGTGHALLAAKPFISNQAMVITADDYYGPSAFKQMFRHFSQSKQPEQLGIVAYPISNTLSDVGGVNRGICNVIGTKLQSVLEYSAIERSGETIYGISPDGNKERLPPDSLASMTCWGVTAKFLSQLEKGFILFLENYDSDVSSEYFLPDCIQHSIIDGTFEVSVYQAQEQWLGVTYQEELLSVAEKLYEIRQG